MEYLLFGVFVFVIILVWTIAHSVGRWAGEKKGYTNGWNDGGNHLRACLIEMGYEYPFTYQEEK